VSVSGERLDARPNPFQAGTSIRVVTGRAGERTLLVCDVTGRTVRHLAAGSFLPGVRELTWDGRDDRAVPAPTGLYLVRLLGGPRPLQLRVALLH
jgi:hypothetical protein